MPVPSWLNVHFANREEGYRTTQAYPPSVLQSKVKKLKAQYFKDTFVAEAEASFTSTHSAFHRVPSEPLPHGCQEDRFVIMATSTHDAKPSNRVPAILSVFDKTGLLDLAKGLVQNDVRLLASGGTAKMIREGGFPVE